MRCAGGAGCPTPGRPGPEQGSIGARERIRRGPGGSQAAYSGGQAHVPSRLSQEANINGDPYVYSDSSVLRSLAEIREADALSKFESDHFFARLLELLENPIRGSFDSEHSKHIHHFLFQDVYEWAGEFRTIAT